MITSTISFAMHLILSSYQGVRVVGRLLGYALPQRALLFSSMAAVKPKINFNTKHLTKGDPLPPHTGKPRVYNMRFCPFAERTILVLNAKGIDYEVVNIDLFDKPEWYTTKSAFGKVPAVELKEGEVIYESVVTAEFIDEVYPQRPLFPKDPVKKAYDKIIVEAVGPLHALLVKEYTGQPVTEEILTSYFKSLDFIQSQLKSRGTKFLDGDEPGFADYMVWPWFERILALEIDERAVIKPDKHALLLEYLRNLEKDPAVSQYLVPKEVLRAFAAPYKTGSKPDYELLTKSLKN